MTQKVKFKLNLDRLSYFYVFSQVKILIHTPLLQTLLWFMRLDLSREHSDGKLKHLVCVAQ